VVNVDHRCILHLCSCAAVAADHHVWCMILRTCSSHLCMLLGAVQRWRCISRSRCGTAWFSCCLLTAGHCRHLASASLLRT
jgi:hypothetical protein